MKRSLRALLDTGSLDDIAGMAEARTRVLGTLVSLTFDADARIAWRAVEAMGCAAARVADADAAPVREHLRRLMWLMTEECGGICWRAPEAMAEIVARRPLLFADYIPIVVHLLVETAEEDLAHFRPGMLWALGRLGRLADDEVRDVLPAVRAALDHPDAQVRGMAAWCLGRLGRGDALASHPDLRTDEGRVAFYEDGVLTWTSVARLTEVALGDAPGRG